MVHAPDVIAAPARPEESEPDDGDDGDPRRPVPTGRRPFDRLEFWVGVAIVELAGLLNEVNGVVNVVAVVVAAARVNAG